MLFILAKFKTFALVFSSLVFLSKLNTDARLGSPGPSFDFSVLTARFVFAKNFEVPESDRFLLSVYLLDLISLLVKVSF